MNKNAFTLAEVLITLTIIGVIAALTIPTLMKKYEEQQILTGVKAAYSILQNAVKMSIAENGQISDWDIVVDDNYNTNKSYAEKYIKPYLKTTNICKYNWSSSNEKCFATSKNYKTIWYGSSGTQVGLYSNGGPANAYMIKLANGMDLAIASQVMGKKDAYISGIKLIIDINGSKGGSVMGRDVFVFSIVPEKGVIPGLLSGSANNNCSKSKGGNGAAICGVNSGCGCAELIVKNSFQFPDNYELDKIPRKGDEE